MWKPYLLGGTGSVSGASCDLIEMKKGYSPRALQNVALLSGALFLVSLAVTLRFGSIQVAIYWITLTSLFLFLLAIQDSKTLNGLLVVLISHVCAVYLGEQFLSFGDPIQLAGDAEVFRRDAIDFGTGDLDIASYALQKEGVLAIYVWGTMSSWLNVAGESTVFYKLANILSIAIAYLCSIKTYRYIQNDSLSQSGSLITFLYAFPSALWLPSGILLRDGFILGTVAIVMYTVVRFERRRQRIFCLPYYLLLLSLLSAVLYALRKEFVAIPILAAVAYWLLTILGRVKDPSFKLIFAGICVGLIAFVFISSDFVRDIVHSRLLYSEISASTEGLGATIFSLPVFVRELVQILYQLIFPIPFWHGFFQSSFYYLTKSFGAILTWLVMPYVIWAVLFSVRNFFRRDQGFMFVTSMWILGLAATAIVTMESRHFLAFFPFFAVSLAITGSRLSNDLQRRTSGYIGAGMLFFLVHVTYLMAKFI